MKKGLCQCGCRLPVPLATVERHLTEVGLHKASSSFRGKLLMMEHTEYLSKIGRAGGSMRTKAKKEAAQKNGELGGRPRLTTGTKDEKRRREQLREAQARRRAKLAKEGK